MILASVEKHSGEDNPWEEQPLEHQISGRIGVSAAALQGKGPHKRNVYFTETGIRRAMQDMQHTSYECTHLYASLSIYIYICIVFVLLLLVLVLLI